MTCTYGRHEFLFHVLYGESTDIIIEFIIGSAQRLYSLTDNTVLRGMVQEMVVSRDWSLQKLRALFFLLLNVDMQLKDYICDTGNPKLLAIALGVPLDTIGSHKSSAMVGAMQANPLKLSRFLRALSLDIVPAWCQNQTLTAMDLVGVITEEYVVS
jgi:hypothetical protein